MADEPNVEVQAREMGWVPQEQFRGDTAKWVDAATFVKRGEEVMPLLKANNKRLQSELDQVRGALSETQLLVKNGQEAIQALKDSQTEFTKAAIQRTKAEIRGALRAARESGDSDAIETLEEQLDDIRDTEREIKTKAAAPAPAPAPSPTPRADPEFVAWQSENPWFGTDIRRTNYVLAEAQALRQDPENRSLLGRAFYDKASANVDAMLNPRSTNSKVETGSGSASAPPSQGGGSGKKTYRDLPADARAVCDRQAEMLVGPGRAFKTAAEWQQNYADQYFVE